MKQKIHKLTIRNLKYPHCNESDMAVIRRMFGDIEIVKVRQCLGGEDMKIWFKTKDSK